MFSSSAFSSSPFSSVCSCSSTSGSCSSSTSSTSLISSPFSCSFFGEADPDLSGDLERDLDFSSLLFSFEADLERDFDRFDLERWGDLDDEWRLLFGDLERDLDRLG